MPRPSRQRSVEGEANLARRIQREREYRGMSYEGLAKLMTGSGCKIQGSAIFKIEKADPPRRITVDELIAFARVFDVSVENLLTPVEVLRTQRGQELLKEIDEADELFIQATQTLLNSYAEYFDLAAYEPEMREYVDNHRFSHSVAEDSVQKMPLFQLAFDDDEVGSVDRPVPDDALRSGVLAFYESVIETAGKLALLAIEENKQRGILSSPVAPEEEG